MPSQKGEIRAKQNIIDPEKVNMREKGEHLSLRELLLGMKADRAGPKEVKKSDKE